MVRPVINTFTVSDTPAVAHVSGFTLARINTPCSESGSSASGRIDLAKSASDAINLPETRAALASAAAGSLPPAPHSPAEWKATRPWHRPDRTPLRDPARSAYPPRPPSPSDGGRRPAPL